MLSELKHQGSKAEKSAAKQFNQGVRTNVLKPTKGVREGKRKIKHELSNIICS